MTGSSPDIPRITLTPEEMAYASEWGRKRHAEHRGRHDAKVLADGEQVHVKGAQGEFAFAKYAGLPWTGKFLPRAEWDVRRHALPDVAGFQVRTALRTWGELKLHPSDADDDVFVLVRVTKQPATFAVVGWVPGYEGKQREFWKDVGYGRPCYYVPVPRLHPMLYLYASIIEAESVCDWTGCVGRAAYTVVSEPSGQWRLRLCGEHKEFYRSPKFRINEGVGG